MKESTKILLKCEKVANSCQTKEQQEVALAFIDRAYYHTTTIDETFALENIEIKLEKKKFS